MEIFGGSESATSVFSIINRTATVFGEAAFVRMLSQPRIDSTILRNRQAIIQELIDNEELFNDLDAAIQVIKKAESDIISFLKEENKQEQENPFAGEKLIYFNMGPFKKLNTYTLPLEVSNKLDLLRGAFFTALPVAGLAYMAYAALSEQARTTMYTFWSSVPLQYKVSLGSVPITLSFLAYLSFNQMKIKKDICNNIQAKLIHAGCCIRSLEEMHRIIAHNKNIAPNIEKLDQLKAIVSSTDLHSADFNKLIGMLKTNTFTGSASFFSVTGRVLAAGKLMKKVAGEFIPALEVAGELDAYLSVAKLYKEFANKRVHISFAEFIESDSPYLEARNFWNPLVDPEVVVANDLVLGANERPNNVILTGPNTGGKSTVIKGIILNVLFAQTFGMAFADKLVLTPFANVNCYLNITDDLAAGTSLFKAEVLRAKELINSIRTLDGNLFSFTIMDEVFSGTSPKRR